MFVDERCCLMLSKTNIIATTSSVAGKQGWHAWHYSEVNVLSLGVTLLSNSNKNNVKKRSFFAYFIFDTNQEIFILFHLYTVVAKCEHILLEAICNTYMRMNFLLSSYERSRICSMENTASLHFTT